jgi:hypothetical protein
MVLYGDHIYSPNLPSPEVARSWLAEDQFKQYAHVPSVKRVIDYCEYAVVNKELLLTLESEQILFQFHALKDRFSDALGVLRKASPEFITMIVEQLQAYRSDRDAETHWGKILEAGNKTPPVGCDLIVLQVLEQTGDQLSMLIKSAMTDQPVGRGFALLLYFSVLIKLAEVEGLALSTWSAPCREAVWATRHIARDFLGSKDPLTDRIGAQSQLGEFVLERYLPAVDKLPIQDVLWIREKRSAELMAFREGVASLATKVDVTLSATEQKLQIRDIVVSQIDPAVRDLEAAISASKLDILRKTVSSTSSLVAAGTVAAVLSYSMGSPLNLASGLAAVAAAVGTAAVDSAIEQKKLLNASQWSFLLRLRNPF